MHSIFKTVKNRSIKIPFLNQISDSFICMTQNAHSSLTLTVYMILATNNITVKHASG